MCNTQGKGAERFVSGDASRDVFLMILPDVKLQLPGVKCSVGAIRSAFDEDHEMFLRVWETFACLREIFKLSLSFGKTTCILVWQSRYTDFMYY